MYIIGNGSVYIAQKEFKMNESTSINTLSLEQVNALSFINKPIVGETLIRYWGIVENKDDCARFGQRPKKHLKHIQIMYGDGFKIEKA